MHTYVKRNRLALDLIKKNICFNNNLKNDRCHEYWK